MEELDEQKEPQIELSFKQKTAIFAPTALGAIGGSMALHAPLPIAVAGIVGAFMLAKKSPEIYGDLKSFWPTLPDPGLPKEARPERERTGEWTLGDRLMGRHYSQTAQAQLPTEPLPIQPEQAEEVSEEEQIYAAATRPTNVPGVARISIDSMVTHTPRNSYEVFLGRSLTRPKQPAVKINFYKRHIKLIGASQHGKSSMAAALIESIVQTHDASHVQIALLDLEDKTSRLFLDHPSIAKVRDHGQLIPLHARSYEQVLKHLEYTCRLIDYRYKLSEAQIEQLPVIIVYLEEFIDLKDYFKQRVDSVDDEEKAQAKADYARLVFCIKKIARRGLKVLVQLLMCAQVDYRDDDLQEALVNVTSGISFCVRVSAASAAGFYQTELLRRNAQEDQVGQAVVEMPDCKDLILAPEYDLRARLKALDPLTATAQREAHPVELPVALKEEEALEELQPKPGAPRLKIVKPRRATVDDAIAVWNERDGKVGRPTMVEELRARELECSNYMAEEFLRDIRRRFGAADDAADDAAAAE